MFHITYDFKKEQSNIEKHGLSFEDAYEFDFDNCVTVVDDRKDYGEKRYNAMGMYKEKLHTISFTNRDHSVRIISFRVASKKEKKIYEQEKNI